MITPLISPSLKLSDICSYLSRFEIQLVGAGFSDEVRSAQQTLEGSCISPPSLELLPGHRIAGDISIVNVSDFKFSTTRRFQRSNYVVNAVVVHVNADHRILRLGRGGFLVNGNNATAIQFGHAKAFRIGDLLQKDLRAVALLSISID